MHEKYVGQLVQIIYQDAKGDLSHRKIRVRRMIDGKVMAIDLDKRALRAFKIDRILTVQPIGRTA